ncbi:beta strand repeat-containing protein, partial [Leptothrix ochracea]|uniref:beta strand repeat-containing protein n=1 Tax=Leptothrix ochracea TaxID=735331 RepID=UPI0034E212BD
MHQGFPPHRHRLARFLSVGLLALAWVLLPTLAHATVSVSKQFLPFFAGTVPAGLPVTTASQGDVLTLGIDIQNNNLLLTGGVLTDPLPLGMVLAPLPNPRATAGCAPAGITFVALPGASTFSLSGAQVPPQVGNVPGACSIYVDVTVPLTLATAPNTLTTLNNTIPVTTGFTALDTATNAPINNLMPAQRSITVTSLAALQVTKTFAPATVVMGESTNITLTLTNPNAVPVGVTALGENLPAGLSAQNLTPLFQGACSTATAVASGTTGNVTLTFTNLTLPANGACTLVWPAQVGMFPGLASTTLTNTIAANSMVNSRGLSQAAATRNLTVQAPLNPTKTLTPATAATNQPVVMTINLQNRSATQTLSAVNFSDVFPVAPGAMTLSPGAITATGCGAPTLTPAVALGGETSLQLSGATMAPGATCVITASVQVNTAGAYTNTVNAVSYASSNPLVGAQTTGAFSAPLTAYSQMLISAKAARDPRVGTNAAAGNVAPGNLLRYQVTLNNYSSAQQALVSFIDPLPASGAAQLTFVPAPAPIFGASCGAPTISPNTLANPALVQFDNIAIAGGTTAAPTACTIDFWVQVPMNWPVGTAINNGSTMDLQQNALSVLQGARPTANSATRAGITTAQTIAPATILQGDLSLLTITLTNNNYVDVLNASLLNAPLFAATAAAEVRLADLPGASTTCGGTPVFTALAGATSLTASGLTIPARGSCTVTVRVRGVVPGTYLNTLPAANVSGSVTVNGVTTTISPVAASTSSLTVTSVLSAAKSFMPTAVSATGGVSRVTVQINNVGTAPLTNVQVTDPLPAGLAVANPANASTTCNGLTILNAVPGSAVAQLQGATVAAGIPCLFQFDAVTTGTAGMTASVNTVPAVTGVVADGGIYNITAASATLTKVAAPAVSVTKSFNPATLMAVGQTSRLQITINNAGLGAIALSNLGLIDNLPLGVVLAATPAVSTTCAGGSVQASPGGSVVALSGGSLPAGASCVFEANITLTSIGTHNNTLPIGIVTNNENITNTAAFTANLQTQSPIGVQKSFAPTSVGVNTPSRLTIQLINARDVTVNSLTVTDTLPLGVVPAVPSAASTTCPGGGVSVTGSVLAGYQVSMSGASLAGVPPGTPGTVCEVSLNVQSPTAGVFINTIPTNGASAIDSVSGLLMANLVPTTATLEVRDTTVLAQAFAAPSVKLGAPNRLTITISNPNSIPLTAVALTDLLPAQVSVALVPNAATTCVGGLVSASAGSSSIRLSGATVPAAVGLVSGSCTVSVDVLSNVPGTYTNTLPAGAVQSNEGVSNLQPVSASFSTFNLPTLGKEFLPVQIA